MRPELAAGRLAAAVAFAVLGNSLAAAEPSAHRCVIHKDLAKLDYPLTRTGQRIASGKPLKIVAIGSSSTAGAGASSAAATYPSRLAVELAEHFHGRSISIVNRGIGGEQARDMLARLDTSVFNEEPDLVIWQVGTNAVLNDTPLPPASRQIANGVRRMRDRGIDVILIDPQFAPKVLAKPETPGMVTLLAETAKGFHVGVFHRYALMRRWNEVEGIPFSAFLSRDQLHMNDWSYACVAKVLAAAIVDAATHPIASASAQSQQPLKSPH